MPITFFFFLMCSSSYLISFNFVLLHFFSYLEKPIFFYKLNFLNLFESVIFFDFHLKILRINNSGYKKTIIHL